MDLGLLRGVRSKVLGRLGGAQRLRVGFVGAGQHARTNLYPCLQYLPVELAAVCTQHPATAESAATVFGAKAAYADVETMLSKERLDAVLVCVNATEHFRIARAALDRGLHVFLEKPATATLEEAEQLIELERKAGRFVMVGFQKRHAPAYVKARAIAQSPSFGPLSSVSARLCVGPVSGEDRFLLEVAIHHLDLVRFFASEVADVHVETHRSKKGTFTFALALRFRSGAVGTLHLSTAQSWQANNERLEITGEGEFVVVDNMLSLRHYRGAGRGEGPGPFAGAGESFWEPNFTSPTIHNQTLHLNGFGFELEHFVESVRAKRRPKADLEDFRQDLLLIQAIRASNR